MIELLDCTLRDGAYIVDSKFGDVAIRGIINKLQNAGVELIECGWLKNKEHEYGTSFYHTAEDVKRYLDHKNPNITYVVMIDWDRYDTKYLEEYDGTSIDAVRVVFPYGRHREAIKIGSEIRAKGYKVYFQAANTLAYSDEDLRELATSFNEFKPEGVSVVDTFGAMYEEDLDRILNVLDADLNQNIKLGFHSHNNQQLAFSNAMHFVKKLVSTNRDMIVDSSLCGMGRGAGNATTELVTNFLNSKYNCRYNLDAVMDAIDMYMTGFQEKFKWGYSTPYCIAGMYCCHVNNIAYLLDNHRTNAHDMRNIIESLSPEDRKKYDYDLLEKKYLENQGRQIDDSEAVKQLGKIIRPASEGERKVLLIAPGKSSLTHQEEIKEYISINHPVVIAVNALLSEFDYDFLFMTNVARYEYASQSHPDQFSRTKKILLSNIKKEGTGDENVVNFNRAIKRGWPHFDNAVICALRLMESLQVKEIAIAGFDGFKDKYNESYADETLPAINPGIAWEELNAEIRDMYMDFVKSAEFVKKIDFVTDSIFEK